MGISHSLFWVYRTASSGYIAQPLLGISHSLFWVYRTASSGYIAQPLLGISHSLLWHILFNSVMFYLLDKQVDRTASCGTFQSNTALDISIGLLARRTFQTAGPVRASTFYLSLARTGHLDICRATRFQIVVARTMTNHSMYFSRGRPSHISTVFALSFCYSETPA